MKKSMIALTMAFALVLSLCACGGQNSNTPSGKTLLEHGLDVIATMDEMADSDEYINFYTASKEMAEIVKDIGKGDHSAPTAVYKITIAKEAMDAWDKPIRSIYVDFHKERQEACCAGKGVRLCTEKGNAAEAERHENDSTPLENGSGEEGAREGLPQFRDSFQQGVFRGIYSRRRGH